MQKGGVSPSAEASASLEEEWGGLQACALPHPVWQFVESVQG